MAIGSSKDAAGKLKAARNPFMGKTRAQMKKMYDEKIRNSGKSGKALREIANQMQAALKAAPKVKKTAPTQSKAKPTQSKAERNFSGVGPSNAQRRKDSSPEAMAAADKRRKNFDGVGPSREQRIKDSSAEAMKPEVKGSRRRFVKRSSTSATPTPKDTRKFNRRGRRVR